MKHLTDQQALAVAEDTAPEDARDHAASCARCATAVGRLRTLLGRLDSPRHHLTSPPVGLTRWARAYVDVALHAERRTCVLGLLAFGAAPVAGVRNGVAQGSAVLYGDARHQLDVRVEPHGDDLSIHGQVVPLDDAEPHAWHVVMMMSDGQVHETTSDAFGEFTIDGLTSSTGASLVLEDREARLVVPRVGRSQDGGESPEILESRRSGDGATADDPDDGGGAN